MAAPAMKDAFAIAQWQAALLTAMWRVGPTVLHPRYCSIAILSHASEHCEPIVLCSMSNYLACRCATCRPLEPALSVHAIWQSAACWMGMGMCWTPSVAEGPHGRQFSDQLLFFLSVHTHCLQHLPRDAHYLRFSPDMNELNPIDTKKKC